MSDFPDTRRDAKPRTCLRCSQMFLSAHAGNRICEDCESKDVRIPGIRQVVTDGTNILENQGDVDDE